MKTPNAKVIQYPRLCPKTDLAVVPYPDKPDRGIVKFFVAAIAPVQCRDLVAVLIGPRGERHHGRTLRQRPATRRFLSFFQVRNPNEGDRYVLQLVECGQCDSVVAELRNVVFQPRKVAKGLTIEYPATNGENCCSDYFLSWGYYDDPDTDISSAFLNAIASQEPVAFEGVWYADWMPVTPGTYNLTVNGNSTGPATRTGLNLATEYC
ncbi:MAG: hypothetical protein AB7K24_20270 [Gemmataceae bacterium]